MIIGLTGTYAAGKDTVAEYLEKNRGLIHYSLSDELRRELEKRGIAAVRENLIRIGTELRAKEGNSVLAKRVSERFIKGKNYVITSVRHPAEIEELKKRGDFIMVNVDAPVDIRFERIRSRKRPGDPETVEKLFEMEQAESQTSGSGQQLGECRKMADHTLINNSCNLEGLHLRIDKLLAQFGL